MGLEHILGGAEDLDTAVRCVHAVHTWHGLLEDSCSTPHLLWQLWALGVLSPYGAQAVQVTWPARGEEWELEHLVRELPTLVRLFGELHNSALSVLFC